MLNDTEVPATISLDDDHITFDDREAGVLEEGRSFESRRR